MFKKVLIANRGEIACRIAEVLKARGIPSVAIYSEADADAPHRHAADEAVCVGPPPVKDSYLDQDAILEACARLGVDAVHPGYGLLSENTGFCKRLTDAGITFIGPTPEAIDAMGDKAKARAIAAEAGVPVVPGSPGPVNDDEAAAIAEEIGYPVLIKAAGGGGGIGMTVVKKPERLARGLASCRDRGRSSFANPEVYLEKFVERPRHIEVQILADHHGHVVHLFERECTLQRRHQKVIEEAPSPFASAHPELRAGLTEAAVKLAQAIGYHNAGTVEFIVAPDGSFYFIEMNTRLQVEHPVTEAITGVDIIGWQLDIAAGEALTIQQDEVGIQGASIECRIYAEDPDRKFMPSPGHLTAFSPPEGEGVRVDAGYRADQTVTPYYDPMLAKLTVHHETREAATARTQTALGDFQIEGVSNNVDFLRRVLDTETFATADFDTTWLERFAKGK
ncbi:MAG: acetyl/propionyl/methylcrotonyl-CoA carboxylase subunit alpha [Bradymonadia bacterium]